MAALLGLLGGGGGIGGMFGKVEEGFTDQFVTRGVSTVNFFKNIANKDIKSKTNAPKTAMRQFAKDISCFVPEIMREQFIDWIQTGQLLEDYASQPQSMFPTEEQLIAEELYMHWIHLEMEIRHRIFNPEQRVSFEEISLQMKQHMEQLICFIMEACTTKYIGEQCIMNMIDQIEEREKT